MRSIVAYLLILPVSLGSALGLFEVYLRHNPMQETWAISPAGLDSQQRDKVEVLWDLAHSRLIDIHEYLASNGVLVGFVAYPAAATVSAGALEHMKELLYLTDAEMLEDTSVSDSFLSACQDYGVWCESRLADIRERNLDKDDLFYHWDGHMTAAGNAVLGELIADSIEPAVHTSMADQ